MNSPQESVAVETKNPQMLMHQNSDEGFENLKMFTFNLGPQGQPAKSPRSQALRTFLQEAAQFHAKSMRDTPTGLAFYGHRNKAPPICGFKQC